MTVAVELEHANDGLVEHSSPVHGEGPGTTVSLQYLLYGGGVRVGAISVLMIPMVHSTSILHKPCNAHTFSFCRLSSFELMVDT